MKTLLILVALAGAIAGCASKPSAHARYADCAVPVTRDAGMGVLVPDCQVWTFGPDPVQRKRFEIERKAQEWRDQKK